MALVFSVLCTALMETGAQVIGDEFDFQQVVQQQKSRANDTEPLFDVETLVSESQLIYKTWQEINVGDIIICKNRDRFPAGLWYLK